MAQIILLDFSAIFEFELLNNTDQIVLHTYSPAGRITGTVTISSSACGQDWENCCFWTTSQNQGARI